MKLLAIETTSTIGSIAISDNGRIIYSNNADIKITHSERLLVEIKRGLDITQIHLNNLDAILVSNGPGSFTGVRIGLATAKGLATPSEIPLIPFNTIEVNALHCFPSQLPVCVIIDAKMNEIYAGLFDENYSPIIPAGNYQPKHFLSLIKKKVVLIGNGVERFQQEITDSCIDYEQGLTHQNALNAELLISLFYKKKIHPKFNFEDIAKLEPYYMRKSQAELSHCKK